MTAKFEADSTFVIVGRGMVLAGWVIDGKVRPGMSVSILTFPQRLVIEGIELITQLPHAGLRRGLIGLRFRLYINEEERLLWKNLDVKGKLFEINDAIH